MVLTWVRHDITDILILGAHTLKNVSFLRYFMEFWNCTICTISN